jgi:acyl dehydratase
MRNSSYQMRGKYFDEFELESEFITTSRTVTETDVVMFTYLSGDYNPLHNNEEYMKGSQFKTRIAQGVLILVIAQGLANQLGIFEGTTIAVLSKTTRFTAPVFFGDTLTLKLKVLEKKETRKLDRGVITLEAIVFNEKKVNVLEGEWVIMIKRLQPIKTFGRPT